MCELLGLSFNQPVNCKISFTGFRWRGRENYDGWGLALYPDESALVFKEPLKITKSSLSKFLLEYLEESQLRSKIFIGHVRKLSSGGRSFMNTHPFLRELNGKEYVFAHNGTLRNYEERLKLGRFRPVGETDSEHLFCHLLGCMEEKGITKWSEEEFNWLTSKLREINELGELNCIFSDGELLFCYHDVKGHRGLCLVRREAPYGPIKLRDEDLEIDLAGEKSPHQKGFIVATEKLTNEEWTSFRRGELKVFKDGEMIYSKS